MNTRLCALAFAASLLSAPALAQGMHNDHGGHHGSPAAESPAAPQPMPGMPGMGMPGMGMQGGMHGAMPGMGMMNCPMMQAMQAMQAQAQAHGGHPGGHPGSLPPGDQSVASLALNAVNEKMHRDMAITFTGDADVDFARAMIAHHRGAIDMARVVLAFGSDPEIRELATAVVEAQEEEIEMMENWLAARAPQ